METSLRYGGPGYSNSLRIHTKEKLPIDSKTYLQVLSFSFLFLYAVFSYTECIWKMGLKLGHFCYGNVSAFWLDFGFLGAIQSAIAALILLFFFFFFVRLNWNARKLLDKV